MLVLLSLSRYLNILYKHGALNRLLEYNHGLNVLFCALLALCWSLPPLFNIGNRFTSEGLGFHCSLHWNNPAFRSCLFIFSLFAFNYFFSLFFLTYNNLRIYFVLRTIMGEYRSFNHLSLPILFRSSKSDTIPSSHFTNCSLLQAYQSNIELSRRVSRLQLLKIDQHYARITAIMVTQFIITWSPYALVVLLTIYGRFAFIHEKQILSLLCALLAKISLIFNPLILIYTSKMRKY